MSTPLKRLTNRLNSKKSTGARTSAGRRTVSRNATRHGMLTNSVLLPGESEERFSQMSANFDNELAPQSETEQALVDMMTTARWRQMRLWGIERAAINQEMLDQLAKTSLLDAASQSSVDLPTRAALAFRSLADNSRSLDLINRYETANSRLFFRAMQRLTALREAPETELEPETPTPAPSENAAPATPENKDFETKPNADFSQSNQNDKLLKNQWKSDPPGDTEPPQPPSYLNLSTPKGDPY